MKNAKQFQDRRRAKALRRKRRLTRPSQRQRRLVKAAGDLGPPFWLAFAGTVAQRPRPVPAGKKWRKRKGWKP